MIKLEYQIGIYFRKGSRVKAKDKVMDANYEINANFYYYKSPNSCPKFREQVQHPQLKIIKHRFGQTSQENHKIFKIAFVNNKYRKESVYYSLLQNKCARGKSHFSACKNQHTSVPNIPITNGCLGTFPLIEVVGCSTSVAFGPCKWNPEKWAPDEASIISSTAFEPMV